MSQKTHDADALLRLIDTLVDDVLETSDEDLLAEAKEDSIDVFVQAEQAKVAFRKAISTVGKLKLTAARAALDKNRVAPKGHRQTADDARRRLESILTHHPDLQHNLTLAARKGQGKSLSDKEVEDLLDDLAELGLSDLSDEF